MMHSLISHTSVWTALTQHQQQLAQTPLRALFAQDPERFTRFSHEACGILLDFSKTHLTTETLDLLAQLADTSQLRPWIMRMFAGEEINHTEHRAAFHVALRSAQAMFIDGHNVTPKVHAVLNKMQQFSEQVRSGAWKGFSGKPIQNIVNIGIGGSDLGPAMVARALRAYQTPQLHGFFVSNADSTHLAETLAQLNPETTLFIIASKTFTTQETLLNAHSARRWICAHFGTEQAIARHFVAISTNAEKVQAFGIDLANMFEFWDWVGGRYSLWSAIGLPIMVLLGAEHFRALLAGAEAMDTHFKTAPWQQNLPVLMGLIGLWYSSFFKAASRAVLPYDFALELFPSYLQQLIMESLGKHVTRAGAVMDYVTCPILWGAAGNNGQHAFYQLLHQGTQMVLCDVLIAIESQQDLPQHQEAVLSNALGQAHVLMQGRDMTETQASLPHLSAEQWPHRVFTGNQPSMSLVYKKLSPHLLGSLIALYEHQTFVQSVCWDMNAFDQWGVELGKQVANSLLPELAKTKSCHSYDSSTAGLVNYIKARRARE